jgi:hypothetical protein
LTYSHFQLSDLRRFRAEKGVKIIMASNYNNPASLASKIDAIQAAWTELAPNATFGGYTLAEFTAAVNASFTTRTESDRLSALRSANISARDAADEASREVAKRIVASVKGDKNYGDNSPLYRAMGYGTASERSSGLSRVSGGDEESPAPTV